MSFSTMFTLFTFLLLVFFNVYTDAQDIEVVNSGMMRLRKNDMVVVLYVTVQHHGDKPRRVMVTMVECCERITEEDTDCDLIDLYGGDFGIIQPGAVKNFTLIFPNVYGHNRRGTCLVNVLHRCLGSSEASEVHHRIEFDTVVSTEYVPQALQGWYNPETLISCESPDLDPFDHCNPVNCHLKYSGYRNYYNRKWKMCQRVPVCVADPNKELPDIVYIPNSNICRNLENSITKEDIEMITNGNIGVKTTDPKMVNIRCHHGEINPKTGLCVCDYGWKSEIFDQESYNPGSSIYSMCNIKCNPDDDYKYLPLLVGVLLGFWLFLCVFCCEKNNYFCVGRRNMDSFAPHAAVYFPLRGSNDNCSPMTSMKTSKTSGDGFKHSYTSHVTMPVYQVSEKTLKSKSVRASSRSRMSFSSDYNS